MPPTGQLVWWRFRKHRLALFSAAVLILFYIIVLFPDFFATQDPEATNARQTFIPVQGLHLFDGCQPEPLGAAASSASAIP